MSIPLAALEAIVDACGAAPAIGALLPAGVRHRQLTVGTLLTGILLVLDDDRPAQRTRVRAALIVLPGPIRSGSASSRVGRPGRTSSPAGKPSTSSA